MFTPEELYEIERKVTETHFPEVMFWSLKNNEEDSKCRVYYDTLATMDLLTLTLEQFNDFEKLALGKATAGSERFYEALTKAAKDKEFKNKINNYLEDKT